MVAMLVVAAFFGGMSFQKELDRRRWEYVCKGFWTPDGGKTRHELEPEELVELGLWEGGDILEADDIPEPPPPPPDGFVPAPLYSDHE